MESEKLLLEKYRLLSKKIQCTTLTATGDDRAHHAGSIIRRHLIRGYFVETDWYQLTSRESQAGRGRLKIGK